MEPAISQVKLVSRLVQLDTRSVVGQAELVSRLVQLSTESTNSLVELVSHLDPSLVVLQPVGSSCQLNRCFAIKVGIAVGTGVGTAAVRTSKVVNC